MSEFVHVDIKCEIEAYKEIISLIESFEQSYVCMKSNNKGIYWLSFDFNTNIMRESIIVDELSYLILDIIRLHNEDGYGVCYVNQIEGEQVYIKSNFVSNDIMFKIANNKVLSDDSFEVVRNNVYLYVV